MKCPKCGNSNSEGNPGIRALVAGWQCKACDYVWEAEPDTSDIPEAGEDWFARAKIKVYDDKEVTPGQPYEWEGISKSKRRYSVVHRMRIPGGWLYRNTSMGASGLPVAVAMVFVSTLDVLNDPDNVSPSL